MSMLRRIVRWAAFALLLVACGRPIAYPRSAEIREGVSIRIRTNLAFGKATVRLQVPEDNETPPSQVRPQNFSGVEYSGSANSATFIPVPEGDVGFAPTDEIEVSGWVGLRSTGVDVRAQLLGERDGGPFALALSLGALLPSVLGSKGVGGRFGVDLSKHVAVDMELLLNAYLSWEPRQRDFRTDDFPIDDDDSYLFEDVTVVRDEVKLTLPVGLHVDINRSRVAMIIGVIPEFTLSSDLSSSDCSGPCGPGSVTHFEQFFAFYVTLGFQFGVVRSR